MDDTKYVDSKSSDENLKILFITNGFPPHRTAGTEIYTAGLAKELKKRGHSVQVLCAGRWHEGANYWNGYDDDIDQGIPVRRIHLNWKKAPRPFRYLYDNPVVGDFLVDYLSKITPDLVHVTSCETLSASVLRIVKKAGLPLVLSLTDFWFLCPRINLMHSDGKNCSGTTTPWECLRCNLFNTKAYRWSSSILPEKMVSHLLTSISKYPVVTRRRGLRGMAGDMSHRKAFLQDALTLPDQIVTASPFAQRVFMKNGVDVPIKVHPYGHDLSWLKDYHGKTNSKSIRIGFIGQIVRIKGVHLLLKAARVLNKKGLGDKFSLSIYGNLKQNTDYSNRLQSMASHLSNVEFCGTYPHEKSGKIFANLDVLVVPSLWFDFPLIIYEAFSTHTPVVATNLGGMAEAVEHEVSGLLFERNDSNDLARQLSRVVDEPGLLKKLRSGIPAVKRTEEEVEELEQIYCELIELCMENKTREAER